MKVPPETLNNTIVYNLFYSKENVKGNRVKVV